MSVEYDEYGFPIQSLEDAIAGADADAYEDWYDNLWGSGADVYKEEDDGGSWWDIVSSGAGSVWDWVTDDDSPQNGVMTAAGLAGLAQLLGANDSEQRPTGYQGGIPNYTYDRQMIQQPNDPNRRPGSGGRRYFTDGQFVPEGIAAQATQPADEVTAPTTQTPPPPPSPPPQGNKEEVYQVQPIEKNQLAGGGYLGGETNGMADEIPANIDGQDPAALSDGEYVFPADVVAYLGGGNNPAGGKALDEIVANIRKGAIGSDKQIKQIDPNKYFKV